MSPTISLCMIVRNEAALLPRFIASVEGLWDQFVAVDTGSTDGSQALLAAAGAEVSEIPWPDDFAKARNAALDRARGDFVLVLDADELPGPGLAAELRALITDPAIGAATLNITSLQPNGSQRSTHLLRFFPGHPGLRYRYRIHEDISGNVLPYLRQSGQRIGHLQTPVEHVGYTLAQLAGKNKQERDQRLLRLAIADDPNDLYSRFKLMEQYRLWGDQREPWRQEAQQCQQLLAAGIPIQPPHIAGELLDLVRIGLFGDAVEPGRQFLLAHQGLAPDDAWHPLALGSLHEQAGDLAAAFECYQATLALANRLPTQTLLETRGLMGLARLSIAINDLIAAGEFTNAAAERLPDDPEVEAARQLLAGSEQPAASAPPPPATSSDPGQRKIHLCIIQPRGHIHALGFLDQARFFRYQFRRLGAEVSIGKNRLRHDAINFIFGAHVQFEPELLQRYRCVIVNLEQLGPNGSRVTPDYLQLLRSTLVVDYTAANVAAYRSAQAEAPLITLGHAPYLAGEDGIPLEERPIDILFYGSANERRAALLLEIEAAGWTVSVLQPGIYGPERDREIRRAKTVFNCHHYETALFEQARAFHCLSLGTPVVSERTPTTAVPPEFEDGVFWVPTQDIRQFFQEQFATPAFFTAARCQQQAFAAHDTLAQYANVLAQADRHFAPRLQARDPWHPARLHVGSGALYMHGWFNVDISPEAQPDAVLDLSLPQQFPLRIDSPLAGPSELAADSLELIYTSNVLEHVRDLPQLMKNCLTLLKMDGIMVNLVPYEHANGAWQDPTHIRAMNENSWLYYTDWFYYFGWFEARFHLRKLVYLDVKQAECPREQAFFISVTLQKAATTPMERAAARTMRPDFGGVPDDDLPSAAVARPTV
jgi:SAM-dependent methyltransferase